MKDIPIKHISNNQEPGLIGNFTIRSIEELTKDKDLDQDLHRHDFYLILFFLKGSGFHEIDFINYPINDYSVFLMKPGQVHRLNIKTGSKGYILQFNKEFCFSTENLSKMLLRKVNHLNFCQLNSLKFEKLTKILDYINDEYTNKYDDYNTVIQANLSIFFIELIRHRNKTNKEFHQGNPYKQEKLEKFLDLVEDNFVTHKQVSQYAEMLNLTSYQLNAITKSALNKNASDLINEYIILEAKRNLLATANQVNQIAYHLGYDDVSYFIRFFKKHTGYSPDNYRHNSN
ncbi:AraC-like DNA-binding protein [Flavobacterium cauense R2A-7]|uniref:AraC-like DNA-binding protein n=1 Tax=Flavobacterium cauense R2A-7 TaxID=1341154 RepID=A0A562M676_9FLAO|nr:helix-turn-helix domain-containing protein [Flavobacterium cauense]KGO82365.1 AraC family transcriptional regulator [Flavobacterium cauense R2A-7]TWI15332.1 AraC-like DNA-binding protein [Flavobacterium cauense R2A-7]